MDASDFMRAEGDWELTRKQRGSRTEPSVDFRAGLAISRQLCVLSLRFRAIGVRAEFPGSELPPVEVEALVAAVLNTPSYGAGIRLAPDARLDDGWLDAVMVEDFSVFQVLALLPHLVRSGELRTARVRRFQARAVKYSTNRSCMFHGDGEILGPTPVEIDIVPEAVRVLAPALK